MPVEELMALQGALTRVIAASQRALQGARARTSRTVA